MKHKNHLAELKHKSTPRFNKSMIALAILGFSSQNFAQETQPNTEEEDAIVEIINVRGVRSSVIQAQELKREADTFVDAITASDIGALPDRSVLEAMQRIPGISIERFAAANDPDHFGVEGSGAVIRGMSATRSEFNGRDSFTANSGRGLSFQDVPPELMGSVQVYKNQSADLIEGGIGGTVSLHTRLPFDSEERIVAVSADLTYSDLIEETTPSASAMFSDSWETDAGKFGFLVNVASSELESLSHSLQSEVFLTRDDLVEGQTVLAPNGGNFGKNNINRERQGLALAAQWESPDRRTLITGQFMRSDATLAWTENTFSYQTDQNNGAEADGLRRDTYPLDGTPAYEFDDSGTFINGTITDQRDGGWRSNGNDQQRVPIAADWGNPSVPQFGNTYQTTTRTKEQRTIVDDYAFNVKFRPNDTWSHEFDAQYIDATTKDDDVTLFLGTQANMSLNLKGDVPRIELLEPWNGHPGGNGRESNPAFFQTKSSYYWRSAMDHYERSEGDSLAFRYDTKYIFDNGFFSSVKAGVRYAQREQTVRFSAYNWQSLGAIFSNDTDGDGYAAAWLDLPSSASLIDEVQQVSWDNHHRGDNVIVPGGTTLHPSIALVQDYANWGSRLADIASDWEPLSERQIQNGVDADGNPTYEQLDGPFRPAESNTFVETNKAAYVRFDFEYDELKFPFTGNFGIRYIEVKRETDGAVTFPNLIPNDPTDTSDRLNYLPADDRAFGNYGTSILNDVYRDDFILPSFNIKVELDDDLIARFAVSKAIAYPDTGNLKNYVNIEDGIFVTDRTEPAEPGGEATINGADVTTWEGNSGNPYLAPMESIQYDFSLEWYFSPSNSLTTTVFYKDLSNFFVTGAVDEQYTNNGVTNSVRVQKPLNTDEGTMQGIEFAYSQFFDFLPAPFDGLGVQANYTYIEAEGVPNSNTYETEPDGKPKDGPAEAAFESLPLEGQSKHTANLVLTYEKNDLSARLAYNWRSEYLLTARDVIAPYRPIYNESAGFLDGSIFYNATDNIKVGIQAVNLLDTVTKTTMQIDDAGTRTGRSWFVNDRRFSFVVRANF
ncbi:TonB-dependent receptor [Aliiglaciecola sp. SL4]|uniref:TonB-dependent receptor n=1 Tax=Aliiglaciecola sp. SL4 TaxID=3239806 RepID=UPI00355B5696